MKKIKNKNKFVVAVNLLANPKTGELMSKSRGQGVFLNSPPVEMYGAIMAQPDEMIDGLFVNCTRLPLDEKAPLLARGPRAAKARVAREIVQKIYGPAAAAEADFDQTFRDGGQPEIIPEISLVTGADLVAPLIEHGLIASKAEWRRLIQAGAVENAENGKKIELDFSPQQTTILKIGKRRWVKIVVS